MFDHFATPLLRVGVVLTAALGTWGPQLGAMSGDLAAAIR
jgi:hypothetical protein